ncbi:SUMF1/EgtB/PvdO family nonheme iron enzyme [Chitinilyticum aquatile]|uniref:SUMF1/EgtB/PvdO family nonheme iron enzyme n=1 Tax=Chitinilyticum aquatile TaxID=362520 RepID=UPI0004052B26|nr:SUMF1/EgtB/PvdO family nonheme iron enzyme [Chitinilyticum aquatile]
MTRLIVPLLTLTLTLLLPAAHAGKRVALLIGNSQYAQEAALKNPGNDARLLASVLRNEQKFDTVIVRENLGRRELVQQLQELATLAKDADTVLVYYSGHGMQNAQKRNYLLPVDAAVSAQASVESEGVPADLLLETLESANAKLNIVILDACRNNPLAAKTRSGNKGLARMESERSGFLIAYSTRDGQVALDGDGQNSPYASALAQWLGRKDLPVRSQFDEVYESVKQATAGKQLPVQYGDITGKVYLDPARSAPATTQTASTTIASKATRGSYTLPAYAPGKSFRECDDCPEMVWLPQGSGIMGSQPGTDNRSEEQPQHAIRIAYPLAMGRSEVTRGQWAAFVEETGYDAPLGCWVFNGREPQKQPDKSWRNPGFAQSENDPVVCVNYEDAERYLAWLSRKTGGKYRLPSETEWEYAARAGSKTSRPWGDSPDESCRYANGLDQSSIGKLAGTAAEARPACTDKAIYTNAIASYQPNAFGLYDLIGNVSEWTADCWFADYTKAPSDGSARSEGWGCDAASLRGGDWLTSSTELRTAVRDQRLRTYRGQYFGFRVVREVASGR